MKTKKIKLQDLKVESFITQLNRNDKHTVHGREYSGSPYVCIPKTNGLVFCPVQREYIPIPDPTPSGNWACIDTVDKACENMYSLYNGFCG